MTDDNTPLRDLLIPLCPLGTADSLILGWVHDHKLFRVKRVRDHYIDVWPALVNHRLCTTPVVDEIGYGRFWCYEGRDQLAWTAVVMAAAMWDGSDDTEPLGWNKSGQTGEWRDPGAPETWQTAAGPVVLRDMLAKEGWPRGE